MFQVLGILAALTPLLPAHFQILGTVGEPINPEAWRWYHEVVGDKRCPIVDTCVGGRDMK